MSNQTPYSNVEEACTVTQVRLYSKVYNDLKKIADSHEISVEQLISDTILDYLYPKKSDSSDNSANPDTFSVTLNLSKNDLRVLQEVLSTVLTGWSPTPPVEWSPI